MKYGNIIYNKRNERLNLGDDMQLLAIENLYKEMNVDYNDVIRIEFSELQSYDGEEVIVPISFPLISYNSENCITCYSDKIIPIFLGLNILTESLPEKDVAYLNRFSPIGCRDLHTFNIMKKYDIPAYLFGCMTMTFPKVWIQDENKDKIFCIDVSDKLIESMPPQIRANSIFMSNIYDIEEIENTPEKKAKEIYEMFIKTAKLVVTARLHIALPCIAAGIPVIFAKDVY